MNNFFQNSKFGVRKSIARHILIDRVDIIPEIWFTDISNSESCIDAIDYVIGIFEFLNFFFTYNMRMSVTCGAG